MSHSQDYIRSFKNYLLHEKRYSEHTIDAYLRDLHQFENFLLESHQAELLHATDQQVRHWIVMLMTSGIQSRSVNRKLSSLRTYYHFLKKNGNLKVNPTSKVQGPKMGKRLPMYLKENEMDQLHLVVEFPEGWQGMRDRLILRLLYECGLRRAELIGLRRDDVNYTKGMIKVMGKGSKERLLPIHNDLIHEIQEYLRIRSEEDFDSMYLIVTDKGQKAYPKMIYNKVVRYLSMVTSLEKRSPHVLRHTFATHLTGRGAEINAVKELLGHASLAATQVYTHNDIEKLKKAYKGAHPRS